MNWLSGISGLFANPWIFWAGLGLVAAPVIIHLLHRRRFRVVEWAAMDFLRAAIKRNRRILQLRDWLLLALRMLAMLLLGLALAQLSCSNVGRVGGARPLHAVLLVDNSMSMGYQSLEGTLLDAARNKAKAYIERLPPGSRVSVIPLAGARRGYSPDPYYSSDDAIEALDSIEAVDRTANMQRAMNDAKRACEAAPELAKRIVLFGDQQVVNWSGFDAGVKEPGGEDEGDMAAVQLVNLAPDEWENTSVAGLRIPDGLADVDTPATIVVELRYQSSRRRAASEAKEVQVTLEVDGVSAGAKVVTLDGGAGSEGAAVREVAFEHLFTGVRPEPGQSVSVPVRAYISPDRLPADDERSYVAQVVAALPVVFVDQYSADEENVAAGRIGETRPLRRLLAPLLGGAKDANATKERPAIQARHITIDELTIEMLGEARLVVIAGVADPGPASERLREYVEQGGRLFIAAGGEFDPAAWQASAWNEGKGILPSPLESEPLGVLPEEASASQEASLYNIAFESLGAHPYFQLAEASEQELRDLVAEPLFFKAVRSGPRADIEPAAKVLAELNDEGRTPLIVERAIGKGRMVFFASGLTLGWNTLADTNAMVFVDRLLRSQIESTLPKRNFPAQDRIALALPAEQRGAEVSLSRPRSPVQEPLDTGFIGANEWGVTATAALLGGLYRLNAIPPASEQPLNATNAVEPETPAWSERFAVQSPALESDLTSLSRAALEERAAGGDRFEWVEANEEISLAGRQSKTEYAWWYLAAGLLLVLVVETALAAWPHWRTPS